MTDRFRLTLAQLNPDGGRSRRATRDQARAAWGEGTAAGADMVALPEMFVTGYQSQDLVMKPAFVQPTRCDVIEELARDCADGPALGIGGPSPSATELYNAYWICRGGEVAARILKHILPNYTVFDEKRIYDAGPISGPYRVGAVRIGIADLRGRLAPGRGRGAGRERGRDPAGAERLALFPRTSTTCGWGTWSRARVETGLPLVYLNMVGGQDDQVFDGGELRAQSGRRAGGAAAVLRGGGARTSISTRSDEGWRAETGARDAASRTTGSRTTASWSWRCATTAARSGFTKVLLGLSGGIDSAIVAAIAADALGPENVRCVMLPSEYTSRGARSRTRPRWRARSAAGSTTVPIEGPRQAMIEALAPLFEGLAADVTEENIQSRLRGLMLMALSNKFGEMLLTTGNKSEVAVGYATIYGDMAGGYNPIKDLYKTRVFETCRWRNANHRDWMRGRRAR